eukprot:EG_transcript_9746
MPAKRAGQRRPPSAPFLLANYQFALPAGVYARRPDLLRPASEQVLADLWPHVEVVLCHETADYACPICLEFPAAARVGMCGHAFCLPCVLQYLHAHGRDTRALAPPAGSPLPFANTMTAPCPLCHERLVMADLRPLQATPVRKYHVGEPISLVLLRRRPGSAAVQRCAAAGPGAGDEAPLYGAPAAAFNRYLAMTLEQRLALGAQEADELQERLAVCIATQKTQARARKRLEDLMEDGGTEGHWVSIACAWVQFCQDLLPSKEGRWMDVAASRRPPAAAAEEGPAEYLVTPKAGYDFYYQESQGQALFLAPADMKRMLAEAEEKAPGAGLYVPPGAGRQRRGVPLPTTLTATITALATVENTPELGGDLPFAAHLPLGAHFVVCSVAAHPAPAAAAAIPNQPNHVEERHTTHAANASHPPGPLHSTLNPEAVPFFPKGVSPPALAESPAEPPAGPPAPPAPAACPLTPLEGVSLSGWVNPSLAPPPRDEPSPWGDARSELCEPAPLEP